MDAYWNGIHFYNFDLEDSFRIEKLENLFKDFDSAINIGLNSKGSRTKPQPMITNAELREIFQEKVQEMKN